jgi:K(+)-stimulated pyrophosphate-energized sodium pump
VTAFLFVWITEYYTEARFRPVQSIARLRTTGPATNIISGLAVGMETPAMPVVVISAALLLSYYFGVQGLAGCRLASATTPRDLRDGDCDDGHAELRGVHSGDGYVWADYGQCGRDYRDVEPAGEVRERTDKLDSAGNTTKALTKGYAIGSASLAAFLLFSAYLERSRQL